MTRYSITVEFDEELIPPTGEQLVQLVEDALFDADFLSGVVVNLVKAEPEA